jgi:hypothetical protein
MPTVACVSLPPKGHAMNKTVIGVTVGAIAIGHYAVAPYRRIRHRAVVRSDRRGFASGGNCRSRSSRSTSVWGKSNDSLIATSTNKHPPTCQPVE